MFTFGSDILTHPSFSLAFGVTRRDPARVRRSSAVLAAGFTRAVAGALLLALIIRGRLELRAYDLGLRPVSRLIDTPNWVLFSVAEVGSYGGAVSGPGRDHRPVRYSGWPGSGRRVHLTFTHHG